MSMNRKMNFKKVFGLLLSLSLVLGCFSVSFAGEISQASLSVSGDSVYEMESGKSSSISFQLKNNGTGNAENVSINAKVEALSPLRVTMRNSSLGSIGGNAYKTAVLNVTVSGEVTQASYPITLEYTYSTTGGEVLKGSETIYIKMKGFDNEPSFALSGMSLSPATLSPGETSNLSGRLTNDGGMDMYDVTISLTNLSSSGISLTSGFSNKNISKLLVGGDTSFAFSLAASADMAAGNYPVTIKLDFKDVYGKAHEKTQDYYINVGGVAGQKADLEIRNMVEPSGTYGVNQNFTVQFNVYNNGKVAAKNIVVTAKALEDSAVVPKSGSIKTIASLEPGASTSVSFTLAATAAATTRNYPIEFSVEYTSGGTATTTFKQFAGVNVSNPDKEEDNSSKPKIIVSDYSADPLVVMAGEEFDLNMTFLNTHKEKAVKNIKMYLTLAEETSSSSEKSGNIFTPVNSSNTFYFDAIPAKGTVQKSLRMYVVPEAQPKTYTLTVNFEYEDGAGKEYTATELLGINVKQVTEIQVDEFSVPDMVEMYSPVSVAFNYYNTGKVKLNNVMVKIEGEVDTQNRNTYVGNMDTGSSEYYEASFTPNSAGEVPVAIVISYEDSTGEVKEERREFVLNVSEPYVPEAGEGMEEPTTTTVDMKSIAIGVGVLLVFAIGLFVFVKRQKGDPEGTFAESIDNVDDEDDDEDDEEGMSV